jgi:hypothetical protein
MIVKLTDVLGLSFAIIVIALTLLGSSAIAVAGPKWGGKIAVTMFRFALAMFLLLLAFLWMIKCLDDKMFEIINIKGIWILMNRVHPYLGLNHIWHGN